MRLKHAPQLIIGTAYLMLMVSISGGMPDAEEQTWADGCGDVVRVVTRSPYNPGVPLTLREECDYDESFFDNNNSWDDAEDFVDSFIRINTYSNYYSGKEHVWLEFEEPLGVPYDFQIVVNGAIIHSSLEYDHWDGDVWMVGQNVEAHEWPAGEVTVQLKPRNYDCLIIRRSLGFVCPSGQGWYPNWDYGSPRGCCTVGCWCEHPSTGEMGCWQECARLCEE